MSSHQEFPVEARKYGDKFTTHVGITCCDCHKWEWKPIKKKGLANRTFHQLGWRIGSRRNQDVCPQCIALHQNRKPSGEKEFKYVPPPETPKPLGGLGEIILAAAKASMPDDTPKAATVIDVVAADPEPTPVAPRRGRTPLTDSGKSYKSMTQAEKELHNMRFARPAPPPEMQWPEFVESRNIKTQYRSRLRTRDYTQFSNAAKGARTFFINRGVAEPKRDRDYFIYGQPGAWNWIGIKSDGTIMAKPYKPRDPAAKTAPKPVASAPKETTPMPDPITQVPAPSLSVVSATLPTREQRQAIAAHLDNHYDTAKGRYFKDGSDEKVSQRLDMPRQWITRLRVDLYGDHDRNELVDVEARALREAITHAAQAKERLLTMASEAERIEADLTARYKRLKGI